MPERALRLNAPSLAIIERGDGTRTVLEIISELQRLYSKAEPQKVEHDVIAYLAQLRDEQALEFVPAQSGQGDRAKDSK